MEQNELKIIKSIIPVNCPECNKQLFVVYQTSAPTTANIINEKDIKKAKEDAINRIKDIVFKDEKKKKEWLDWLSKEENLIEPSDVESLVKEILNEATNDNTQES